MCGGLRFHSHDLWCLGRRGRRAVLGSRAQVCFLLSAELAQDRSSLVVWRTCCYFLSEMQAAGGVLEQTQVFRRSAGVRTGECDEKHPLRRHFCHFPDAIRVRSWRTSKGVGDLISDQNTITNLELATTTWLRWRLYRSFLAPSRLFQLFQRLVGLQLEVL